MLCTSGKQGYSRPTRKVCAQRAESNSVVLLQAGSERSMGRELQLLHLAEAERHVASGLRHVARQEAIIAAFETRGVDTVTARALLVTFRQSLSLHEQHLAQIRRELLLP